MVFFGKTKQQRVDKRSMVYLESWHVHPIPKKIHEGGRFGGFGTHKKKTKTHKKSELPENSGGSGGLQVLGRFLRQPTLGSQQVAGGKKLEVTNRSLQKNTVFNPSFFKEVPIIFFERLAKNPIKNHGVVQKIHANSNLGSGSIPAESAKSSKNWFTQVGWWNKKRKTPWTIRKHEKHTLGNQEGGTKKNTPVPWCWKN